MSIEIQDLNNVLNFQTSSYQANDLRAEMGIEKLRNLIKTKENQGITTLTENEVVGALDTYKKAMAAYKIYGESEAPPRKTNQGYSNTQEMINALLQTTFWGKKKEQQFVDDYNATKEWSVENWGESYIKANNVREILQLDLDGKDTHKDYIFSRTSSRNLDILKNVQSVFQSLAMESPGKPVSLEKFKEQLGEKDYERLLEKGKQFRKNTKGTGSTYNERVLELFAGEVYLAHVHGKYGAICECRDSLRYASGNSQVLNKKAQDTLFIQNYNSRNPSLIRQPCYPPDAGTDVNVTETELRKNGKKIGSTLPGEVMLSLSQLQEAGLTTDQQADLIIEQHLKNVDEGERKELILHGGGEPLTPEFKDLKEKVKQKAEQQGLEVRDRTTPSVIINGSTSPSLQQTKQLSKALISKNWRIEDSEPSKKTIYDQEDNALFSVRGDKDKLTISSESGLRKKSIDEQAEILIEAYKSQTSEPIPPMRISGGTDELRAALAQEAQKQGISIENSSQQDFQSNDARESYNQRI